MKTEPQKYDAAAIQKRFVEMEDEVEAIRERASSNYRHEAGEQYTPMLKDVRTLLGELNVITEFWDSAEKEMDEIRKCDKCDLCEDHHE